MPETRRRRTKVNRNELNEPVSQILKIQKLNPAQMSKKTCWLSSLTLRPTSWPRRRQSRRPRSWNQSCRTLRTLNWIATAGRGLGGWVGGWGQRGVCQRTSNPIFTWLTDQTVGKGKGEPGLMLGSYPVRLEKCRWIFLGKLVAKYVLKQGTAFVKLMSSYYTTLSLIYLITLFPTTKD